MLYARASVVFGNPTTIYTVDTVPVPVVPSTKD